MKNVITKFRKVIFFEMPLSILMLNLGTSPAFAAQEDLVGFSLMSSKNKVESPDTYTINFNNVSIVEYIRFISKIANLNFVFDENELQFTVTIVSEEPISVKNILSALVQVLRIHGLRLLEQENNLLITKSGDVNQISTIVSSDLPDSTSNNSPIVTRVFRIKVANPNSIATIIRPMTSTAALIEVSMETRQLIITDITTNIDKISALLTSLDSPHSPLEIESYEAKNTPPVQLATLATQILSPFTDGNPLILVPQLDTNMLYVVSTPYLNEKALALLQDLDTPSSKTGVIGGKPLAERTIFLYKIQYKPYKEILSAFKQISDELNQTPHPPINLIDTLNAAKWIKESNSLFLTGDTDSLTKIKEILASVDTPSLGKATQIFLYKPKFATQDQMQNALNNLAQNLDPNNASDRQLAESIKGMTWIKDSSSFLFKGDSNAIDRLKELLVLLDSPEGIASEKQTFYLYRLQHAHGDVVLSNLQNVAQNLKSQGSSSKPLMDAIDNIRWIKDNNSLLITGNENVVAQVKELILGFDIAGATVSTSTQKTSFFIYKPKVRSPQELANSLHDVAADLNASGLIDPELLETISTMRVAPATHSIVFTGTTAALDKIKGLLVTLDTSGENSAIQKIGKTTFLIYKLQYAQAPQFMASIKGVTGDLEKQGALDPNLAQVLNSMRWIKETNSIIFTGPEEALVKAEEIAKRFDVSGGQEAPRAAPANFVLYKPQNRTGPELISILTDFEQNLSQSGVEDPGLYDAINNLKWIDKTGNLLISGDQPSVTKVQELLVKFDTIGPGQNTTPSIEMIDNTSFLVYKLQYHKGEEIKTALKQIATELGQTNKEGPAAHQGLINAINSLQWIMVTNSLIATGEQEILSKIRDLIQNLDVPLRQVFIEVLVIETSLTNSQNFGLQWGGKAQYLNKLGMGTGNFPSLVDGQPGSIAPIATSTPPTSTSFPGNLGGINATSTPTGASVPFFSGFDLGVIGDIILHKGRSFISLGSLVNALEQDVDSTVVLNPKILTQDNNNSTIFVGSNIPFVGSVVNNQTANTLTTTSLEYRDIGLSLSITPVLGNNDIVTLDIQNDISELTSGAPTITVGSVSGITTSHTSMSTKVHVPNKSFLVLSGMIRDQKARAVSKIPCLGGLPVIGAAFSEHDLNDSKTNIVIFVRPQIIERLEDYKEITDRQENLYKENAVFPILKEQFDTAIDLVKTPENE